MIIDVMKSLTKAYIEDEKCYDSVKNNPNVLNYLNNLDEHDIFNIVCSMENDFVDSINDIIAYYVYTYNKEDKK